MGTHQDQCDIARYHNNYHFPHIPLVLPTTMINENGRDRTNMCAVWVPPSKWPRGCAQRIPPGRRRLDSYRDVPKSRFRRMPNTPPAQNPCYMGSVLGEYSSRLSSCRCRPTTTTREKHQILLILVPPVSSLEQQKTRSFGGCYPGTTPHDLQKKPDLVKLALPLGRTDART